MYDWPSLEACFAIQAEQCLKRVEDLGAPHVQLFESQDGDLKLNPCSPGY